MPRPVHKTNLTNAPASTRLYQGYNPQGQIGFDRTWELKDGTGYHPLGERATLALGLTERCAAMGRGMVYYVANDANYGTSGSYPRSWTELPSLLYVHHLWDDESRQAWNDLLPWQRLDRLSARGNALHWREIVMPVSLNFERLTYDRVRVYRNKSQVALTSNVDGYMYLGKLNDMSQHMTLYPPHHAYASSFIGSKNDLSAFQVTSGDDAAHRLAAIYQSHAPAGQIICMFKKVLKWVDDAHDEWVQAGGYTLEFMIGGKLAHEIRDRLNGHQPTEEVGEPLRTLRDEAQGWSDDMKTAYEEYSVLAAGASTSGDVVTELAYYMLRDETWNTLSLNEKEKIIEIFDLERANEQERIHLPRRVDSDNGGDDQDEHNSTQSNASTPIRGRGSARAATTRGKMSSRGGRSAASGGTPRGGLPTGSRGTPRGSGSGPAGRRAVTTPVVSGSTRGQGANQGRGRGGRAPWRP
ncbi:hypothetical protein LTR67_007468 [Exophiala xenobiotica]